jgi:DNA repair exonuclease SbcCD ATPase subunit
MKVMKHCVVVVTCPDSQFHRVWTGLRRLGDVYHGRDGVVLKTLLPVHCSFHVHDSRAKIWTTPHVFCRFSSLQWKHQKPQDVLDKMAAQGRFPPSLDVPGLRANVTLRAQALSDLGREYKLVQAQAISKGFRLEPSNVEDAPVIVERTNQVASELEDLASNIEDQTERVEEIEDRDKRLKAALQANHGRLPIEIIQNRLSKNQEVYLFETAVSHSGFAQWFAQHGGIVPQVAAIQAQLDAVVAEQALADEHMKRAFEVCAEMFLICRQIPPLKAALLRARGNVVIRAGQVTSLKAEVTRLENQVTEVEGQVGDLESQLSEAHGRVDALTGQVSDAQTRADNLDEELESAREEAIKANIQASSDRRSSQERCSRLEKDLQRVTDERDGHASSAASLAQELDTLKSSRDQEVAHLQTRLAEITTEADREKQAKNEALEQAESRADEALAQSTELARKMQATIDDNAQAHSEDLHKAQQAHQVTLERHQQTTDRLRAAEDKCTSLEADMEQKQRDWQLLTDAKAQVDQSLTDLQKALEQKEEQLTEKTEQLAAKTKAKAEVDESLVALQQKFDRAERDNAEALKALQQDVTKQTEATAQVEQSLTTLQQKFDTASSEHAEAVKRLQDEVTKQTEAKVKVEQSLDALQEKFGTATRENAQAKAALEQKEQQLTEQTQGQAKVQQSLDALQEKFGTATHENAQAKAALEQKELQLTEQTQRQAKVQQSLDALQEQFGTATRDHAHAKAALEQKHELLERRMGEHQKAKAKVDQSLADLQLKLTVAMRVSAERAESLQQKEQQLAEETEAKAKVEQKRQELQQQLAEKTKAKVEVDRSLDDLQTRLAVAVRDAAEEKNQLWEQLTGQTEEKNQALERVELLQASLQSAQSTVAQRDRALYLVCRFIYSDVDGQAQVLRFVENLEKSPLRAIRHVPQWSVVCWPADGDVPVVPAQGDDVMLELQFHLFVLDGAEVGDFTSIVSRLIQALVTVPEAPAHFVADIVVREALSVVAEGLEDGFPKAKLLALFYVMYVLKERFAVHPAHFDQVRSELHGHSVAAMVHVLEGGDAVGEADGVRILQDGRFLVLDRFPVDPKWVLVMDVSARILRVVHRDRETFDAETLATVFSRPGGETLSLPYSSI